MTDLLHSHLAVDALVESPTGSVRVSQVAVDVVVAVPVTPALVRLTQVTVDVLVAVPPPSQVQLSHVAVDVLVGLPPSPLRLSHLAVDVLWDASPPVVITPPTLPDPFSSVPYHAPLTATGGDGGPYTFSLVAGTLPPGLSLTSQGVISGTTSGSAILSPTSLPGGLVDTPYREQFTLTESGVGVSYPFTVRATDGSDHTGEQAYTLTVRDGWADATYEVIEGRLPSCLTLRVWGLLAGMLIRVGTSTFTVGVTNRGGRQVTGTYTIVATS